MKTLTMKLSAFVTGAFLAGNVSEATAQTLDKVVGKANDSLTNIPQLISAVLYIGGAIMAAGGVLALKKHVDDPSREPIRNGIVRLVAGAILLVAPVAFKGIIDTLGVGTGGEVQYNDFGKIGG